MKTSTPKIKYEIRYTTRNQLKNVDYANHLALLSHTQKMRVETASLAAASASVGINKHEKAGKDVICTWEALPMKKEYLMQM
ncbi:unnamed protein product [Schistosoma margrebowiei]|uniref:Uncharacterized protein n=1 Tax=Schistosoma margrebowiei TaxID=48269 RepID=A0A183LEI5_9TREM|nr:unnamed protein product [Schistosoma margrebowiei]